MYINFFPTQFSLYLDTAATNILFVQMQLFMQQSLSVATTATGVLLL